MAENLRIDKATAQALGVERLDRKAVAGRLAQIEVFALLPERKRRSSSWKCSSKR
jgi:hypothetical protein